MGRLHLIRHGQAEWQLARGGDLDSPLTPLGHRQARALARWANAGLGQPARLFTSPLRRARQTSAYLARAANLGEEICDALAEAPFRVADHLVFRAPGAPSPAGDYAAFRRQVERAFTALCAAAEGKENVVAVTHGGVIRTMLDLTRGAVTREIANASVTVIAPGHGGWAATSVSACDHVPLAQRSR